MEMMEGKLMAIVGGPNCRTWSILWHRPKKGMLGVVQGKGQQAWPQQN